MNGKAAQLERWLEAIRQRELEKSLIGQVRCGGHHDTLFALLFGCSSCGAQR